MLPPWVSVAMLAVTLPMSLGAARAAWRGTFRLNLVTWTLWAVVPAIAAAAAFAAGSGLSAVSVLATGLGPAAILTAGLAGHATTQWALTRGDIVCGALAVAATAGWLLTGSGLVAVALSVAADGLAAVPTVRKAWRYPTTESPWGYRAGLVSGLTGLATLDAWAPVNWLFPAYIAVLCATLLVFIATPGRPGTRAVTTG